VVIGRILRPVTTPFLYRNFNLNGYNQFIGGMFLFWIVLIVLAVVLVRGLFQSNQSGSKIVANQPLSARQILEQRYARGEINQEQFLFMLKDLQ
jgi:putative membrane protein